MSLERIRTNAREQTYSWPALADIQILLSIIEVMEDKAKTDRMKLLDRFVDLATIGNRPISEEMLEDQRTLNRIWSAYIESIELNPGKEDKL